MKAQHRHELKTNELAEWLANFPQWSRDNYKTLIYLGVLAVVVIGVYIWNGYAKNTINVREQQQITNLLLQLDRYKFEILQSQSQGVDTSFNFLQLATELKNFAEKSKDNYRSALAYTKRGQALRMELHYRNELLSPTDLNAQIEDAKQSYTLAVEKAADFPALLAEAKFGVAICEEQLNNFDKAKDLYTEIANSEFLAGTVAASQAQQRLKTMDDYRKPVAFRPAPKPVIAPAETQQLPTIELDETAETNAATE